MPEMLRYLTKKFSTHSLTEVKPAEHFSLQVRRFFLLKIWGLNEQVYKLDVYLAVFSWSNASSFRKVAGKFRTTNFIVSVGSGKGCTTFYPTTFYPTCINPNPNSNPNPNPNSKKYFLTWGVKCRGVKSPVLKRVLFHTFIRFLVQSHGILNSSIQFITYPQAILLQSVCYC